MVKQGKKHGPDGPPNPRAVIDVDASGPIPAELTARIRSVHPYIIAVHLVADRGSGSNAILRGEYGREWGPKAGAPPDLSPDEIAWMVVGWVTKHAERTTGPGSRYRVRIECIQEKEKLDTKFTRWASLRVQGTEKGELEVLDDMEAQTSEEGKGFSGFMDYLRTASELQIQQMRAVGEMTAHFVDVGGLVKTVLEGLAALESSHIESELTALALAGQHERAKAAQDHRTQRMHRLMTWWEGFSGPSGEELAKFFREMMERAKAEMDKAGTTDPTAPLGKRLEDFASGLEEGQSAAFDAIWTEDERKLLDAAKRAEDDATFLEIYRKFAQSIGARLKTEDAQTKLQDSIIGAVGIQNARKIEALFKACERRL